MHAHVGSKSILFGASGSARDLLLRYVCASRGALQHQAILTLEGLADSRVEAVERTWRSLLHTIYERIGIDCDNVTLIVKCVDLLPPRVVQQLLSLLATGDVPGLFSLEEQIKMATRVRDEQLVELDNRFSAETARIRHDAERQREAELAAIKRQEKETRSIQSATFYLELEQRQQQTLAARLAQVQLRYQQDCDDYTRQCEVETESVTATIMSLMRPLGITSGKWQQIVDRVRKRLRVVFFVDSARDLARVQAFVPTLVPQCAIVPCPVLEAPDLETVLYGHFHSEVQRLMRLDRFRSPLSGAAAVGTTVAVPTLSDVREWDEYVAFMETVEHALPAITAMAVDIHIASVRHARDADAAAVTTLQAMALAAAFARLLEASYRRERARVATAEWFLYVVESMTTELEKLRDGDAALRARVDACEADARALDVQIAQQVADSTRSHDMMRRYQDAAEQQVDVTNAMEKQAAIELQVPLACLAEANAALLLIEKRHIVEIKSFNSPPLLVHLVLDAVCVLFGLDATWENARRILSDSNVVQNMLAYDKDNVSDEILFKLATPYMSDDRFNRDEVEKQSVAASMMVIWVRAIYQYASTRRVVKPTLDKLAQAQARLQMLMSEFQASKVRVADADDALAQSRAALAAAHELQRTTADEIASREARLESGRLVLECLEQDRTRMAKAVEDAAQSQRLGLLWWNALLTAAFVTYSGQLPAQVRKALSGEWQRAYWRCSGHVRGGWSCETVCRVLPVLHVALKDRSSVESAPGNPSGSTEATEYVSESRADEHDGRIESGDDNDESEDEATAVDLFRRSCSHDRADWQLVSGGGVCFSTKRLEDACFLTELDAAGFPIVLITDYALETEELVLKLARNLWRWRDFLMVSALANDFESVVAAAVSDGQQLLVLDVEPPERSASVLSAILRWETRVVDGREHLVLGTASDTSNALLSRSSTGTSGATDISNSPSSNSNALAMLPLHKDLRIVLTTHRRARAFGEAIVKIPTLSAAIQASDISDMLLDKMWNPGIVDSSSANGAIVDPLKLKLAVRTFAALSAKAQEQQKQLTALVQEAAVHGDFQLHEMAALREHATALQDLRTSVATAHVDVEHEAQRTRTLAPLADVGAAVFSAFNATTAVRSTRAMKVNDALTPPPLAFQLFVPLLFSTLTSSGASSSSESSRAFMTSPNVPPGALSATGDSSSTLPAPTTSLGSRRASVARPSSQTGGAMAHASLRHFAAAHATSAVPAQRLSETLSRMLSLLMPLVRSESDWHRFLLELVVRLDAKLPAQSPLSALALNQLRPSSKDVSDDHGSLESTTAPEPVDGIIAVATPQCNDSALSIDSELALAKLQRWSVRVTPTELARVFHELRALDSTRIVAAIVDGVAATPSTKSMSSEHASTAVIHQLFASTRSRTERMKIALALRPDLAPTLAAHVLRSVYNVELALFTHEDDTVVPLLPPSKQTVAPTSSTALAAASPRATPSLTTRQSLRAPHGTSTAKHGWLRHVSSYPEVAGVLVVSHQPLESFAFVQRAFFQTIFVKEIRVAILQQLVARTFRATNELHDVFLLPKSVFLSNAAQQQALLASGADLHANPLLLIRAFEDIRKMERDKPDVLEAAPLALVNMQRDSDAVHWEGLFHILHRTHQHTTSLAFRRHVDAVEQSQLRLRSTPPATPSTCPRSVEPLVPASPPTSALPEKTASSTSLTSEPSSRAAPVRLTTTRRLSTMQSLLHRHSDISLVTAAYPRLLAVVDPSTVLPVYLQPHVLCLHEDDASLSSESAADASAPLTLKKCVQSTLLRLAFHPICELLQSALAAAVDDVSSKGRASSGLSTSTSSMNPLLDASAPVPGEPSIWQHLSSLVLLHALLLFRRHVLRAGSSTTSSHFPTPSAPYRADVFVSALDQLLASSARELRSAKTQSRSAVFERSQQQHVVLSAYARVATSSSEVAVLRRLHRACFQLVDGGWLDLHPSNRLSAGAAGSDTTSGGGDGDPSGANSSKASAAPLRRQPSSMRGLMRRQSSSFAVNGISAFVTAVTSGSQSAGSTPRGIAPMAAPLLLASLSFPLDALLVVKDMDAWLELMWDFAETLDARHHAAVARLFGGHEATSEAFTSTSGSSDGTMASRLQGSLGECQGGITGAPSTPPWWANAFAWSSVLCERGGDSAASVTLSEATAVLESVLASVPLSRRTAAAVAAAQARREEQDTGSRSSSPVDEQTEATPLSARAAMNDLLSHLNNALLDAYEQQVALIRSFFSTLRDTIADYAAETTTAAPASVRQLRDANVQEVLLALLRNEVPLELLERMRSRNDRSHALASHWSLSDLLAHYQAWSQSLTSASLADRTAAWFWAPALSPAASIADAVHAATLRYCAQQSFDPDDYTVVYTLCTRSAASVREHQNADSSSSSDVAMQQQRLACPADTVAVFDGLCLVDATWNDTAECLELSSVQSSVRKWQRVLLLCSLEPLPIVSASRRTSHDSRQLQVPLSHQRHIAQAANSTTTRVQVPLLSAASCAVREFELPAALALAQSLVTPFLAFAIPRR